MTKKNKGTVIALFFIAFAVLFAIINPSFEQSVKINNHAPEIINKDSLWQNYSKNGDTASTKIRTNQWVVIGNSRDMLNPFTDTVFSEYWQMVASGQYSVKCKKYGSIIVEFCWPLPDSLK